MGWKLELKALFVLCVFFFYRPRADRNVSHCQFYSCAIAVKAQVEKRSAFVESRNVSNLRGASRVAKYK